MRSVIFTGIIAWGLMAAGYGQSFQAVGMMGNLSVNANGVLSTSTDSGFTTVVPVMSVKYRGNFSGQDLASVELTTGLPVSGTPEGSARFAPGGRLWIGASGQLDGTAAQNFVLLGVFSARQTWLFTGNAHIFIGTVLGRITGETKDHTYTVVLTTTNHGFSGNGYVDVASFTIVRVN